MIDELATAIVARYDAAAGAALRTKLGDGGTASTRKLWQSEAPQGTATPYATFEFVGTALGMSMGSDLPRPLVQFGVWDDNASPRTAEQAADLLVALFNSALLTLSGGYTTLRADPIQPGRTLRDPDGGWEVIVEMEYTLEVART